MDYNHYIKTRADGAIIAGWSDGPHRDRDTADAICINQKGSYQVYLTIDGVRTKENPQWLTHDGIPMYKYIDEAVQRRTDDGIAADRAAIPTPPPSPMEQVRADVDFMSAIGGMAL